jgi:hypothetical protein
MNTSPSSRRPGAKAIRWIARILSALIILFWGFLLVAGAIEGRKPTDPPLTSNDYIMLVLMGIWLVGLLIAWKWEVPGASVVLVAFAANAFFNINILTFPALVVPFTGILFLVAGWLDKPAVAVNSAEAMQ